MRLRTALPAITMAVLLLAGATKLLDMPEFTMDLVTWRIIPEHWLWVAVPTIPAVEVALSLAWFLGGRRTLLQVSAAALLAAFSAAYAYAWSQGSWPECGCLSGLIRDSWPLPLGWMEQGGGVLVRNGVLIALVPLPLCVLPRTRERVPAASPVARGFTIIELLVVVVIIAILVGFGGVALSNARQSGRESGSLSDLKNHAAVFLMYTSDERGRFPHFISAEETPTELVAQQSGARVRAAYFEAAHIWTIALADRYYGGNPSHPSFASPMHPVRRGTMPAGSFGSDYTYACSFIADPLYYNPLSREWPTATQLRGVGLQEVLYPSAKSLLVDMTGYFIGQDTSAAEDFRIASFVDGHAERVQSRRFGEQMVTADGDFPEWPLYMPHIDDAANMLQHALDGVRGRDIK